jgi:hypothetical protein
MTRPRIAAALLPALLAISGAALADPFDDAMQAAAEGRHGAAAAAFHGLALAGDGVAAHNLALLFATGRGVPQNQTEALYWAWRARLDDVDAAEKLLARLWPQADAARRDVIAQRLEAGLMPFAEGGDGAAMLQLAAVLSIVRPVPDAQQAHAWQSMAAAMDVPGAVVARDATLASLAPQDRAAAQDHALVAFRDWCGRRGSAAPHACSVVVAAGPDGASG